MRSLRGPAVRTRVGLSLLELLVAVVLLGPITTLVMGLALTAGKEATRAAEISAAEAQQEAGLAVAEAELSSAAPGDGILAIAPTRVRYRARRGVGRWCLADSAGVVVPLPPARWAASRVPVAGRDSVMLLVPDSTSPRGQRRWRLPLGGPPSAETCPLGAPGLRLPLGGGAALLATPDLVQTEEVMELAGYSSGGNTWLGLQHLGLGTAIEPVAGPFDIGGISFEALDSAGAPTGDPNLARAIRIQLGTPTPLVSARVLTILLRG